jgi:flagellar biosynthetic protein FliP
VSRNLDGGCQAAKVVKLLLLAAGLLLSVPALAAPELPLATVTGADGAADTYSVNIQILVLMTMLALLPSLVIMMTAFTRIIVVFAILRQALGLQQTPSNQILIGLAMFLTIFVMMPVLQQVNELAIEPYMAETLAPEDALTAASEPIRQFMLGQTREADLAMFMDLAGHEAETPEDVNFFVLVPAFMTSELKTAFQMGFMIFIPFLVIDLIVASVLMSMGMMMLSPLIISLPFKIMLFVVVDGWVMIMGTLATSFGAVS